MTRLIARSTFSLVLMSMFPSLCVAQRVPFVITSSERWADSRDSRRTQASEWLREISDLDRQIPTLSPTEEAWLKIEYDDEIAAQAI